MRESKTDRPSIEDPVFVFSGHPLSDNPSRETVMQLTVKIISQSFAIQKNVAMGDHQVEVDLSTWTPEERGHLSKHTGLLTNCLPIPEAILARVREELTAEKQAAAKEHANRVETTEAWLAAPDAKCIRHNWTIFNNYQYGSPSDWGPQILLDDPRVIARMPRLETLAVQMRAESETKVAADKAARAAREAAENAAEEAGKARLRDWAMADGSDLLKARIAGNYNWIALARREFAAGCVSALPGDYAIEPDTWSPDDRDNPTLEEMREINLVAPLVAPAGEPGIESASLAWITVPADDDVEDSEEAQFAAIRVHVRCPDGQIGPIMVRRLDQ